MGRLTDWLLRRSDNRTFEVPASGRALIVSDLHGHWGDWTAFLHRSRLFERLEAGEDLYLFMTGDVPDVVFPCGWILEDDRRTIRLYYGAADTTVCVATGDLEEIIGYLYHHCICGNLHEPGECCPVAALEPVEVTGNR